MNDIKKYMLLIENMSKLDEGLNHPIIVVDVQPAYSRGNESIFEDIIEFVSSRTGNVLFFVNAESDGFTEDSIDSIKEYWEDVAIEKDLEIDWDRFEIIDKGYGYLRSWMDNGVSESIIIKVIRELYRQGLNDSRLLFGEDEEKIEEFLDEDFEDWMVDEPLIVEWLSIKQLKEFNGSYIVGGGRNECLREVELMMNAFNIKYKRIDRLVYG